VRGRRGEGEKGRRGEGEIRRKILKIKIDFGFSNF
jgi:hypothetical protein